MILHFVPSLIFFWFLVHIFLHNGNCPPVSISDQLWHSPPISIQAFRTCWLALKASHCYNPSWTNSPLFGTPLFLFNFPSSSSEHASAHMTQYERCEWRLGRFLSLGLSNAQIAGQGASLGSLKATADLYAVLCPGSWGHQPHVSPMISHSFHMDIFTYCSRFATSWTPISDNAWLWHG